MITISDIPESELLLARSAAAKLVKLLGGMLSVGLSSLQLDSPERFLAGRTRLISAILEVLGQTGVRPGTNSAAVMRDQTTCLSNQVECFLDHLTTLASWRNMPTEGLHKTAGELATAYSGSLATARELLQALGVTIDVSQQQLEGCTLIDAAVREMGKHCKTVPA